MSGVPRDPGLQPERTRLAWRRTTLSCTVVLALAVKQALHAGAGPAAVVAAAVGALAWLGMLVVAHRRVLRMRSARPRPMTVRGALAVAGCAVVLAGCATAMLF
ncbi:DUF202 domain-containing protein [Streptomyces sp. NPDC059913]|uniref:DUF202 domain-containing protein n=1 Tax=unclassified Streptomyces TaxID=2593676 RepID=UPI00364AB952